MARYRIPAILWNVRYLITVLSMATAGYQAGLSGTKSLRTGLVPALTFSSMVFLIAGLDRVAEGGLGVNRQPMLELHRTM